MVGGLESLVDVPRILPGPKIAGGPGPESVIAGGPGPSPKRSWTRESGQLTTCRRKACPT